MSTVCLFSGISCLKSYYGLQNAVHAGMTEIGGGGGWEAGDASGNLYNSHIRIKWLDWGVGHMVLPFPLEAKQL